MAVSRLGLRVPACVMLLGLMLAGCRTAPPPAEQGPGADAPWPEQRAALERLVRYGLNGRVAVAANGQGFSANLRYAQLARASQLSLDGPLGIGGLRIELEGDDLEVATSRGEKLDGPEARAELERRLGFALPLEELRWWLLGIPAPGESALNADPLTGEIRDFTQNGWRVIVNSREAGMGFSLPKRLTAERAGEPGETARLKLLVEKWGQVSFSP
jgi:outer membrane lipoprotein LolB